MLSLMWATRAQWVGPNVHAVALVPARHVHDVKRRVCRLIESLCARGAKNLCFGFGPQRDDYPFVRQRFV